MAELVKVHHPDHPGSEQVVSLKLWNVDLKGYGYVLVGEAGQTPNLHGPSAGAAYEAPQTIDPEVHAAVLARLKRYEERETELTLREQALEAGLLEVDLGGTAPVELTARGTPRKRAARKPRPTAPVPVADITAQEDIAHGDEAV